MNFEHFYDFADHYYETHEKYSYTCEDCNKVVSELKKFVNHSVCMHNDRFCEVCRFFYTGNNAHNCGQIS